MPKKLKDLSKGEYKRILERSRSRMEEILSRVIPIIHEVEKRGDEAVSRFTSKFDGVSLTPRDFVVKKERVKEAYKRVSPEVIESLRKMRHQIYDFHQNQLGKDWSINKTFLNKGEGSYTLGQRFIPFDQVGVYVPGGKARYPSTAIMAIVPAKLAGVGKVILASPPSEDGEMAEVVMVAADIAGVDLMLNAGGVQAIAALALGTATIPKVDLIVGPGNTYVNAAKAYLFSLGKVGIDCPAGPSEILVLADGSANPAYVANDLLSQAEHDEESCSVLVATSEKLAEEVCQHLIKEVKRFSRRKIMERSLEKYGAVLMVESLDEAINFVNDFAPEHLEIMTRRPEGVLRRIKNAGSVFLGDFSPVAAADYLSGTNHILPTGGWAKSFSGLSVQTFLKSLTYQSLTKKALKLMGKDIATLAFAEGPYDAHTRSIEIRQE
ncbi:MAG: histidinol dehydrogenase [bacterium]